MVLILQIIGAASMKVLTSYVRPTGENPNHDKHGFVGTEILTAVVMESLSSGIRWVADKSLAFERNLVSSRQCCSSQGGHYAQEIGRSSL
jgi:hypothetical protein